MFNTFIHGRQKMCAPHSYGPVQKNQKKSCVLFQSVAKTKVFYILSRCWK